MYITLSTNAVIDNLMLDENASWTYEEAKAIANYYEDLEEDTGEAIELDLVAIRCDWVVNHINDVMEDYSDVIVYNRGDSEECVGWLREQTQVIELKNDILLYVQF